MNRFIRNILIRRIPIVAVSLITGGILIYYLGFWTGAILNAMAWGIAVFLAKLFIARTYEGTDPFGDDRFLMYFVLALIGRNGQRQVHHKAYGLAFGHAIIRLKTVLGFHMPNND